MAKKEYGGTRYASLWDWSTWLILALIAVVLAFGTFVDTDRSYRLVMGIFSVAFLAVIVILFKSIYYRIDGNKLIVYQLFIPNEFPIDKIESVVATKNILSSPATSLVHRLAVRFSDREVLKSAMPMIISPIRQREFINQLLEVNPAIQTADKES